jgi:hypothetical protein
MVVLGSPTAAAAAGPKSDGVTAQECVELIESQQWESSDVKKSLIELARKQDQQLLAFYRSLKGFPSSFINVATKYVKVSKTKK